MGQALGEELKEVADFESEPIQAIIDIAIEACRRQWFLEQANRAFAILRASPEAWNEEIKERAQWDATLLDGLERDE